MARVDFKRGLAYQGRQLAGRDAAHEVHLEETILRVRVAECPGYVTAVVTLYGQGAEFVAIERYGGGWARDDDLAVQAGKASRKQVPAGPSCQADQHEEGDQQAGEDAASFHGFLGKTAMMPA